MEYCSRGTNLELFSPTDIDSWEGEQLRYWEEKEAVEGNKFSFEQVYKMNLATDVSKTADLAAAAHADLAAVLLAKNLAVQ